MPSLADDAPDWMPRLARLLVPHPGRRPRLTLIDFVDDLADWTADSSADNPFITSKTNVQSMMADLRLLRTELGPCLREAVGTHVEDLGTALERLYATARATTRAVGFAARPGYIRDLHSRAATLRTVLTGSLAVEAAWHDIINAAQDPGNVHRVEVQRTDLLVRLLDATLRDGESLMRQAADILRGILRPWEGPIPVRDRVVHVSAILTVDPVEEDIVVWLGYVGATTAQQHRIGPVTFVSGHVLNPPSITPDHEFFDEINQLHAVLLPPTQHTDSREVDLLVRVALGRRPPGGALAAATQLTTALMTVGAHWAGSVAPESRGSVVLADGVGAQYQTGILSKRIDLSDYELRRAFDGLRTFDSSLARVLLPGVVPPRLLSAVEARAAADEVRNRRFGINPPTATEMRLVIAYEDRVIQQVTALGCDARHEITKSARREEAVSHWIHEVDEAVRSCLSGPADNNEQGMMRGNYYLRSGWAHFVGYAFTNEERLRTMVDAQQFDVRWIDRVFESLHDVELRSQMLHERLEQSEALERRRTRVRNSVAHGNPAHDEVTRSVSSFSNTLSSTILTAALVAQRNESSVIQAIERLAGHWWLVWEGTPTSEILARYAADSVDAQFSPDVDEQ